MDDWSGTSVLVTGGAGFIGSNLVDGLLAAGATVRVLDNFSTGSADNLAHLSGRATVVEGDIRDGEACRKAMEGVSVVFHQAALGSVPRSMREPATSVDVNVSGTARIFEAARDLGVSRVVYASSSSVYGDDATIPKKEGREGTPLSPYALSKVMNEHLASVFAGCFDLELVGLRYFNVYGPRQSIRGPYAAVVPRFFDACAKGNALTIHGDGEQSRDFTFIEDVVHANLLAARAPKSACGRAYNIGAGDETSINEIAKTIVALAGADVAIEHGPPRPGDVRHTRADTSDAERAFGFRATTPLSEGLAQTKPGFLGGDA